MHVCIMRLQLGSGMHDACLSMCRIPHMYTAATIDVDAVMLLVGHTSITHEHTHGYTNIDRCMHHVHAM